ncbi:hypothetical protein AURDEDRAFT_168179 [Auricularia subglabra TFB-10046 SS5]|nr:hypothetical protein AURDEDRAFT_168179 [Auricularia subglabra TFB-10046 SS5]
MGNKTKGCPMSRSLELSYPAKLGMYYNSTIDLVPLGDALKTIQEPQYRDIVLRAFSRDDLDSAKDVRDIVTKEQRRRRLIECGAEDLSFVVPDSAHAPRHDAKSIYWVLLWAHGRALPKGIRDESPSRHYDHFRRAMLDEGSGIPGNDGFREVYFDPLLLRGLLHPSFSRVDRLLRNMAMYFSIPWDLYKDEFSTRDDHAHNVMRRLLLLTMVQGHEQLDVELDTKRPRRSGVF